MGSRVDFDLLNAVASRVAGRHHHNRAEQGKLSLTPASTPRVGWHNPAPWQRESTTASFLAAVAVVSASVPAGHAQRLGGGVGTWLVYPNREDDPIYYFD